MERGEINKVAIIFADEIPRQWFMRVSVFRSYLIDDMPIAR